MAWINWILPCLGWRVASAASIKNLLMDTLLSIMCCDSFIIWLLKSYLITTPPLSHNWPWVAGRQLNWSSIQPAVRLCWTEAHVVSAHQQCTCTGSAGAEFIWLSWRLLYGVGMISVIANYSTKHSPLPSWWCIYWRLRNFLCYWFSLSKCNQWPVSLDWVKSL